MLKYQDDMFKNRTIFSVLLRVWRNHFQILLNVKIKFQEFGV